MSKRLFKCGCSSVVEHELPKLGVEGSIPFTRSKTFATVHLAGHVFRICRIMNKDETSIDLTRRDSFSHWTPVTIRFSDQDPLGHVNNVAPAAYVEAGRTMLIHQFWDKSRYPDLNFALAHFEIDYRAEFHYPGTVDVGALLLRIGTKSFTSGYGLFMGDLCVATSISVNVFFDTAKRRGIEPPDDVRAAMMRAIADG